MKAHVTIPLWSKISPKSIKKRICINRGTTSPIGRHGPMQIELPYWKKSAANIRCGKNPLGEKLIMFNQDFKEFIESLNDNHVRYLIIGGYAVALHGHPRYTKDLDIWVERSRENAQALIQALTQFGMGSLGLSEEDFLVPDQVVQIGFPPNRIDILVSISGVEFPECFDKRVEVLLDGVNVHFIDLEHLKQNKKASGRLQDLADVENLE
jgi:predicted nucleotidyltransferase